MSVGLLNAVLAIPSTTVATNFYLDSSDLNSNFVSTAKERLERLCEHFEATKSGDIVFVGEAAGWRGARQSGVPFTSATTVGLRGSKEPSATTMHQLLASVGMLDRVLLWNAFPLHPHASGAVRTNRTPTSVELDCGRDALRLAIAGRRVVCVGQIARGSVSQVLGHQIPDVDHAIATDRAIVVRHPSYGGATRFRSQAAAALQIWSMV